MLKTCKSPTDDRQAIKNIIYLEKPEPDRVCHPRGMMKHCVEAREHAKQTIRLG